MEDDPVAVRPGGCREPGTRIESLPAISWIMVHDSGNASRPASRFPNGGLKTMNNTMVTIALWVDPRTGHLVKIGSIPKRRRLPLASDSQDKVESRFLISSCFRTFVFS